MELIDIIHKRHVIRNKMIYKKYWMEKYNVVMVNWSYCVWDTGFKFLIIAVKCLYSCLSLLLCMCEFIKLNVSSHFKMLVLIADLFMFYSLLNWLNSHHLSVGLFRAWHIIKTQTVSLLKILGLPLKLDDMRLWLSGDCSLTLGTFYNTN